MLSLPGYSKVGRSYLSFSKVILYVGCLHHQALLLVSYARKKIFCVHKEKKCGPLSISKCQQMFALGRQRVLEFLRSMNWTVYRPGTRPGEKRGGGEREGPGADAIRMRSPGQEDAGGCRMVGGEYKGWRKGPGEPVTGQKEDRTKP